MARMPLASSGSGHGDMMPGSGILRLGFRASGRRRKMRPRSVQDGTHGTEDDDTSYLPGKMGVRGWDTGILRPRDLDPSMKHVRGIATEGQLAERRRKWGASGRLKSDGASAQKRISYDISMRRRENREKRRRQHSDEWSDDDDDDDDDDYSEEDRMADIEEERRREFVRKNWKASCYGHPGLKGWDTGAIEPHPDHHERLHRYFPKLNADHLWDTHFPKRRPMARLKIHRYPWNNPDLVPGGVDCKEPETYRLHGEKYSKVMSRWKARSEKVRLSLTAAGEQERLRRRRLRENPMADPDFAATVRGQEGKEIHGSQGIKLDPGKFRRRAEERSRRNHEQTLYRSFSRMQQYKPNSSSRDPAKDLFLQRQRCRVKAKRKPEQSRDEQMPRGWRPPYVLSSRQKRRSDRQSQLGRSLSGSGRRQSFFSDENDDDVDEGNRRRGNNASGLGDYQDVEAKVSEERPRWEAIRDDLADIIVYDGLYKISDLRALFHETIVAAASDDRRIKSADESSVQPVTTNGKQAAQEAVAFVCNELDLPAIARLALQTPELLAPNFEGRRGSMTSGSGGSHGALSDSDGSIDQPVKITHWSESQDYAFRTHDYMRID